MFITDEEALEAFNGFINACNPDDTFCQKWSIEAVSENYQGMLRHFAFRKGQCLIPVNDLQLNYHQIEVFKDMLNAKWIEYSNACTTAKNAFDDILAVLSEYDLSNSVDQNKLYDLIREAC